MAMKVNLDDTLVRVGQHESSRITHREGFQGNVTFGGVGVGKSVSLGATMLQKYCRSGYSVCCLTVKPEETEEIVAIAEASGRGDDVLLISPYGRHFCDFMDEEAKRGEGSETETIVSLFLLLVEIAQGTLQSNDSYWLSGLRQLLRNTITTLQCADELVTIENVYTFVITAPTSLRMLSSEDFKETYCYRVLSRATDNADRAADEGKEAIYHRDFGIAFLYWTKEFCQLAEKTRSIIVSMLTTTADVFLRGSLRTVFSAQQGREPCPPERILKENKICIVDMSVKQYESVGVIANTVYSTLFMKAVERLPFKKTGIASALYADEFQHFITDYLYTFLQTSRSAGCSVFLITQSINNIITKYGDHGEAKAYNLLGLITNKFAMRNTCVKTNQYFADLIGMDFDWQSSSSVNMSDESESLTSNLSEVRKYLVEPIRFTELQIDHQQLIFEAIVHTGRTWATGENYLRCFFKKP